jgi:hypothetical protein
MIWKSAPVKNDEYERITTRFAFLPTVCMDNHIVWLQRYWVHEMRSNLGWFVVRRYHVNPDRVLLKDICEDIARHSQSADK